MGSWQDGNSWSQGDSWARGASWQTGGWDGGSEVAAGPSEPEPPAGYAANPVAFDGTVNLLLGADFTGVPLDDDEWAIALAFRRSTSATDRVVFSSSTLRFRILFPGAGTPNAFRVQGHNSANTIILRLNSSNAFTAGRWHYALASGNGTTNHMYIDNVNVLSTETALGGNIDFDSAVDWAIGATTASANDYIGDLADFQVWMGPGTYIDFSLQANRDFFYDVATRKPKDPALAAAEFGTPICQMTGATASWHTNKGSGGGFTVNLGSLTTGETPVQWPVLTTQTFIATGPLEGDPLDAVNLVGSGGSGTLDLLFVQQTGAHYWYENNPLGTFTQRTIRSAVVTNAKFEGCAWGDFDSDGNHEAYSCDQNNSTIWVHVQDTPGTPTGTWTGATIRTGVPNAQRIAVLTIDSQRCLLCSYEGDSGSNGGVLLMTYNGGGLTTPANWTATIITALPGAWWLDMAGLVTVGGAQRLYVSSRNAHNAGAVQGSYYLTKPAAGGLHQTWARTTIDSTDLDWQHICTGDFFGNGVVTDAANHDTGDEGTTTGTIKFFNSQAAWAATTLSGLPMTTYRYNLRNITALTGQRNGRDVLLVCGTSKMGALFWDGSAWTFELWQVTTLKADSAILLVNLAGGADLDVVMADSHQSSIYWIDGSVL